VKTLFTQQLVDGRTAVVACSTKADGDLSISTVPADELAHRRAGLVDMVWSVCRQVHSDRVVGADTGVKPAVADAVVVSDANHVVAVHSADCVPVAFIHDGGAVGAAHAGWKGLERGVLESTVRAIRAHGPGHLQAVVGPHIRASEYEFGAEPLRRLAQRFDQSVVSATHHGTPALDLTSAVAHELDRLGIPIAMTSPDCTAADADRYWSYRSRSEKGRFALLAYMTDEGQSQ